MVRGGGEGLLWLWERAERPLGGGTEAREVLARPEAASPRPWRLRLKGKVAGRVQGWGKAGDAHDGGGFQCTHASSTLVITHPGV